MKKKLDMSKLELNGLLIWPYKFESKSFRSLNQQLGVSIKSMNHMEKLFVHHTDKVREGFTLVNWGSRAIPSWIREYAKKTLNNSTAVTNASSKIKFFSMMKGAGVRIPEFTTDVQDAMSWVQSGIEVFGRKEHGSCGSDITLFDEDPTGFGQSDFWVQYKKKKHEYRVHIFKGDVILVQKKVLRDVDLEGEPVDPKTVNFKIRNFKNGFIFQRNDVQVFEDVLLQAQAAFKASGLDFAAFDVIFNEYEQKAYVLEANTAPGLEGSTIDDYVKAISSCRAV